MSSLRWASAMWVVPLVFAGGVLIALSNVSPDSYYTVAGYAAASRNEILIGPLLAAVAAYKTGLLRPFLAERRPLRGMFHAHWRALWPVLVLGPVAGCLSIVSATRQLPGELFSAALLVIYTGTLTGSVCVGILAGRLLPAIVAVPVAALGCFAWLALPAAGTNAHLRSFNGSFAGCCTVDQSPSVALLLGASTFFGCLVVGSLLALAATRRWVRGATATLAALSLASVAGYGAVHAVDASPSLMGVEPRNGDTVCRVDQRLRLCVWPENEAQLAPAIGVLTGARERLEAAGVHGIPTSWGPVSGHAPGTIQLAREASKEDVVFGLALALLPDPQTCARPEDVDVYRVFDESLTWLTLTAGIRPERLAIQVGEDAVAAVQEVRKQSPATQRRWISRHRSSLEAVCTGTQP